MNTALGHMYGFLGRRRIVDSNPSVAAIFACQPSLPDGCDRFMQSRDMTGVNKGDILNSKARDRPALSSPCPLAPRFTPLDSQPYDTYYLYNSHTSNEVIRGTSPIQ